RAILLELCHGVDLPGHADQRIFGRQITIRRREQGRALDVGIVVWAASGDTHQPDTERQQQVEEQARLGQVDPSACAVPAESVRVAAILPRLRHAMTIRARLERYPVERTEADADAQSRGFRTDPGDNLAQKPRAVLETPAVASLAISGAEEFV